MAKGKLSMTEKYAIQGMLHEGKGHGEIAEALGRTIPTITRYIEGELDSIQSTVAEIQLERALAPNYKRVRIGAQKILVNNNGFTKKQAKDLVDKVITKMEANKQDIPTDAPTLARICTRNVSALELTGTHEDAEGNPIAAVMNKAASVRGDEARQAARRRDLPSRTARGAIFQPKQGKMREDIDD